jgi:hypothetical protein
MAQMWRDVRGGSEEVVSSLLSASVEIVTSCWQRLVTYSQVALGGGEDDDDEEAAAAAGFRTTELDDDG